MRHWLPFVYALNFALIFTHEIDSAYWNEWTLFGMGNSKDGLAPFLVINFVLLLVALVGFRQVLLRGRFALALSFVLSAGGLIAFFVHIGFLIAGHNEFTLPASIMILCFTLVVSAAQAYITFQVLREDRAAAGRPQPPIPQ